MPSKKPTPIGHDDDELDELPPLDGEDDAGGESSADRESDDDDDSEDASLDDEVAGDSIAGEDDLGGDEGGWLDDAEAAGGDADDLADDLSLDPEERTLDQVEEATFSEEDLGIDTRESASQLDQGEEGPKDFDPELREGDLPSLDDDAEDERAADADFVQRWFAPPSCDDVQFTWEDKAWERACAPLRVGPMRGVVVRDRGAVAVGRVLALVDRSGRCELPEANGLGEHPLVGVSVRASTIVSLTEAGNIFVSVDGGRRFHERNSWRSLHAIPNAGDLGAVALTRRELWAIVPGRGVVASGDRGIAWSAPLGELVARGMTVDSVTGDIVLVKGGPDGSLLEIVRVKPRKDDRESSPPVTETIALPDRARGMQLGSVVPIAAFGAAMALLLPGVGVFRTSDGTTWIHTEGTSDATALTLLDERGALVVSISSAQDLRAWLVRVPAEGVPKIVAELDGDPDDLEKSARVSALAWDAAHNIVWAAGGFGLTALRPSG